MDLGTLFENFHLEKVELNPQKAASHLSFQQADREAAWEMSVEMQTRIVMQPLPASAGDEQAALDSVYSLFPTTREILRRRGPDAAEFRKVALPVLNQVARPFTAKWHKESLAGAFQDEEKRREFREELRSLQEKLRNCNRMLSEIAGVEDLTDLEPVELTNPLYVPACLDEFRNMEDGWLDGDGLAPGHAGLDWLAAVFSSRYPGDAPLPFTYPTPEGGVWLEWTLGQQEISLNIDITGHQGYWHRLDMTSLADDERELDLDDVNEWNWLAGEIRRFAGLSQ